MFKIGVISRQRVAILNGMIVDVLLPNDPPHLEIKDERMSELITDKELKKLLSETLPFVRYIHKNGGSKELKDTGSLMDRINMVLNKPTVSDKIREISNKIQEINMLNYNEDEVRNLNDTMCKIYRLLHD